MMTSTHTPTAAIEIRPLKTGEDSAWDKYVLASAEASQSHLTGWRRVIERSYGHPSHYLAAYQNGECKGVLPLVAMRDLWLRRSLVSMPFLDDGGICADNDDVRTRLSLEALRLFEKRKAEALDLRHRYATNLEFPRNGEKVMMLLQLTSDPDKMWDRFDAKLRNQIRKATKSGLSAEWRGKQGLADFYEILAANMRDLGSPVHSREFFAAIMDEFADSADIMLVYKDRLVIGGALCLFFRGSLIVPWASSLRSYFSLCPNNLLYWTMIRWGCEKGYNTFDFGRSSPSSGTYRFKKQWGAKEEPLHWQYVSRKKRLATTLHADDSRYKWIMHTWSRLPLSVTKALGPLVRGQVSS